MNLTLRRTAGLAAAAAVSAALLAGCSAGADSQPSSPAGTQASGADTAAAQAAIAPYLEQPSEFPVTDPLSAALPAGTTFAYLQCDVPTCALGAEILKTATQTLGVELITVQATGAADSLQTAMNSIIEQDPDVVILSPIEPSIVASQLDALKEQGTPIVSIGISDAEQYGIDVGMAGTSSNELIGSLMASWLVSELGDSTNAVFYGIPELSFSPIVQAGFEAQLTALCPDCTVREADLPIATLGSTAPSTVVSDLQANPDTNAIVFVESGATTGVPAALETAGLDVTSIVMGPDPGALSTIADGGVSAGLAIDFQMAFWMQVDAGARLLLGDELPEAEVTGQPPLRILNTAAVDFDPSHGWMAFDDFADRFAALWSGS